MWLAEEKCGQDCVEKSSKEELPEGAKEWYARHSSIADQYYQQNCGW